MHRSTGKITQVKGMLKTHTWAGPDVSTVYGFCCLDEPRASLVMSPERGFWVCPLLCFSSYVYKCVCQQHSELLYNDLTLKITSHLQQVSTHLQVSKSKFKGMIIHSTYRNITLTKKLHCCFPGQPTWELYWELQCCADAIHSFSSVYSSCVYVLGRHLFS